MAENGVLGYRGVLRRSGIEIAGELKARMDAGRYPLWVLEEAINAGDLDAYMATWDSNFERTWDARRMEFRPLAGA